MSSIAFAILGAVAFGCLVHKPIAIPDDTWEGRVLNFGVATLIGHCLHASLWLIAWLIFGPDVEGVTVESAAWSLVFWAVLGTAITAYARGMRRRWKALLATDCQCECGCQNEGSDELNGDCSECYMNYVRGRECESRERTEHS